MTMTYNIYCDESCHLEHDGIKPMLLGCVWCPESEKNEIFKRLRDIKVRNGLKPTCELKWNAVSESKLAYYLDVLDYFFDNSNLHFRVLVVPDKTVLRHGEFGQTHDMFYYKMYFDLLKTILVPQNEYNIFIDIKDTRGEKKVEKLVELADFLTGAIGYVHRGLTTSKAKLQLIEKLREKSRYSLTKSTLVKEDKVNIFIWKGRTA